MIDLRLPNITATTERGQLEQIRSYLYQIAEQLNFALKAVETQTEAVATKVAAATKPKNTAEQAQATFSEVKSLIIKSADIVNAYTEQISAQLEGRYVAQSDFGIYKQEVAAELTATAEDLDILFTNTQQLTTNVSTAEGAINSLVASTGNLSDRLGAVQTQAQATQQQTDQIQAATDALTEDTENLMETTGQMSSALQEVVATNMDIKAYIRMGKLGTEGGIDIYGIEIGQDVEINDSAVFSKFMRLSSGKLVFYNADGSVAAMASGDRLLCPQLEAEKMYLGGFSFLPRTNGNLSVRWTG